MKVIQGAINPHFRLFLLDSSILSIVDHNVFRFRYGGLSRKEVRESVSKARVKSLSHREYSQAEDAMDQEDKEWAMGLGRITGNSNL